MKISDSIVINKTIVKNRIMMPPLVCFGWGDNEGFETKSRSIHYGEKAKGGTGIIVVEASGISDLARIYRGEIGLYKDEHIHQFTQIAREVHKHDSIVLVQLVHAGREAYPSIVYSASKGRHKEKEVKSMSLDKIDEVIEDFVNASIRAHKAGLDGVEIHGAHGYLLSQFTSSVTNQREDKYGSSLDNRIRLPLEIVKKVRAATSEDFIIGYRLGVNDPSFKEDIYFAKELEKAGVDIFNVSSGIGVKDLLAPSDYPYSNITYMGNVIHDHIDTPVAVVNGIRHEKDASHIIASDFADFVAIGRGILADSNWVNKAINNEIINICYHCKPRCKYSTNGEQCPWYLTNKK